MITVDPFVLGFAGFLAYVLAWVLLLGLLRAAAKRRRTPIAAPALPSTPAPGRATTPRCSQPRCTGEATWTVHDGIVARAVCFFCMAAGFRKGFWLNIHSKGGAA